jgi:predicted XRE-type DNA-binding protein
MNKNLSNGAALPAAPTVDKLDAAKLVLAQAYTERYPVAGRLDSAIGRKVGRSGVHARAFVLPHGKVRVSLASAIDLCQIMNIETVFQPRVSFTDENGVEHLIYQGKPLRRRKFASGLMMCRGLRIQLGDAIRRWADRENLRVKDLSEMLDIARPTISSMTCVDPERQFGPRCTIKSLEQLGLDVDLGLKLEMGSAPDFDSFRKKRKKPVRRAKAASKLVAA